VARSARPAAPDSPVYPRGPGRVGGRAAGEKQFGDGNWGRA